MCVIQIVIKMFENPTKPDYDLWPVSYFKRSIRNVSLDVWNQRYNDGATASTTKMFLPDAKLAYGIVTKFTAMSGHNAGHDRTRWILGVFKSL